MGVTRVIVPKSRAKVDTRARWDSATLPLPGWVKDVRPEQVRAVEQVVSEFKSGADIVQLDAPTGSGKTLIAELVRREMKVERGLYVCTTKSLQEQVVRDFEYARVLKGRGNYTPSNLTSRERDGHRPGQGGGYHRGLGVSCADCDASPPGVPDDEKSCSYCEFVEDCPYGVARRQAAFAPVGVLNTAFVLSHCNAARESPFQGRELVVMDEADLIERELLGYVELRVGTRIVDELGLVVPKKGSHMTTIRGWLAEELLPGLKDLRRKIPGDLDGRRKAKRIEQLGVEVARVIERPEGWVRENDEEGDRSPDSLVLKPVTVEDVGGKYLWRHGEKWLLMSGTTVSAEGQADALGIEEAGLKWAEVQVPMMFPVENRRVVYAPLATMTRKGQEDGAVGKVIEGTLKVLERHPGVNVLVHTHTYLLAKEFARALKVDGREVITYTESREKDYALERFKAKASSGGAIMVASSMDRGVDLPGDYCRVQVIVKVPMASLGSRQVSERLRGPGGQAWYAMETVRNVMQMTGRAVRSKEDWAVTYVLDQHFGKLLGDGKKMGMWAQWWLDGLEFGRLG